VGPSTLLFVSCRDSALSTVTARIKLERSVRHVKMLAETN
jgi:hypothetical protein